MKRWAKPKRLSQKAKLILVGLILFSVLMGPVYELQAQKKEWQTPKRRAKKKNPVPRDQKSVALGKNIYEMECLECHGDTGKGDGSKVAELEEDVTDFLLPEIIGQSDGALFWKISVGRRPMPAYKKLLKKKEIWHVVNYMRALMEKGKE